jgi:hypothetical protein
MSNVGDAIARYDEQHAFAREIILPEEDRRLLFPTIPWTGGYRWFRSPNIVCLEKYRRLRRQGGGRQMLPTGRRYDLARSHAQILCARRRKFRNLAPWPKNRCGQRGYKL